MEDRNVSDDVTWIQQAVRATHDSLLHVPLPKLNGLSLIAFETNLSPLLGTSNQSDGTPRQGVYVLEQEVRGSRETKSEGDGKGRGSSVLEDIDERRGRGGGVVRHIAGLFDSLDDALGFDSNRLGCGPGDMLCFQSSLCFMKIAVLPLSPSEATTSR